MVAKACIHENKAGFPEYVFNPHVINLIEQKYLIRCPSSIEKILCCDKIEKNIEIEAVLCIMN